MEMPSPFTLSCVSGVCGTLVDDVEFGDWSEGLCESPLDVRSGVDGFTGVHGA